MEKENEKITKKIETILDLSVEPDYRLLRGMEEQIRTESRFQTGEYYPYWNPATGEAYFAKPSPTTKGICLVYPDRNWLLEEIKKAQRGWSPYYRDWLMNRYKFTQLTRLQLLLDFWDYPEEVNLDRFVRQLHKQFFDYQEVPEELILESIRLFTEVGREERFFQLMDSIPNNDFKKFLEKSDHEIESAFLLSFMEGFAATYKEFFGKKEFSEEYYKNLFSLMEAGLETASTVQDALNFTKLAKIINDNDLFVGSDRWFDYLKKLQKKVWSSDSFTTLASTDSEVEDLELLEAYGTSLFIFNRV
jgi:hypothetical protein